MPIVTDLADLYNGADAAALACLTAKLAVEKCLVSRLEETRQMVQQKVGGGGQIVQVKGVGTPSPPYCRWRGPGGGALPRPPTATVGGRMAYHPRSLPPNPPPPSSQLVALFKEYRLMNASSLRQGNKLIYPPTLRMLPLWTLGLLRCAALRSVGLVARDAVCVRWSCRLGGGETPCCLSS